MITFVIVLVAVLSTLTAIELVLNWLDRRKANAQPGQAAAALQSAVADVWYLPPSWRASTTVESPAPIPPDVPEPPRCHVSNRLRTPGFVVLGVVEHWRDAGVDPDAPPPYAAVAPAVEAEGVDDDVESVSAQDATVSRVMEMTMAPRVPVVAPSALVRAPPPLDRPEQGPATLQTPAER
ncbi:hypothetical protein AMAG_14667 [Allomyces macrogynus ATCC 38327]|uniref:Uncharacterized protein n=1 Tax=Allomyces macrogynus (strain ATCC 38327) TaxID=578462 RepID=A0A0L0T739_ALLM3|nr:hypothetical protein AMAG_14667 [Allomyces macrogynus ATCC 38327]|eukprot:KNE70545.1 hypothetical protein AMAG_14667 [Allomyces macrogynus ATCC 38327]